MRIVSVKSIILQMVRHSFFLIKTKVSFEVHIHFKNRMTNLLKPINFSNAFRFSILFLRWKNWFLLLWTIYCLRQTTSKSQNDAHLKQKRFAAAQRRWSNAENWNRMKSFLFWKMVLWHFWTDAWTIKSFVFGW